MKKNLFYIAVIVLLVSVNTFPQGMGWDAKFAFGGGFTPGWFFPSFDGINNKIEQLGIPKLSNSGFFATGGTGYISLPMLKNVRIGGMGLGGSTSEKSTVNGLNREAQYSMSMGGFTIEYSFPFVPNVALSAGLIIGGGNVTVKLYQNSGAAEWNDIWDMSQLQLVWDEPQLNLVPKEVESFGEKVSQNTASTASNIHRELSNSFFMLAPTLNVDIPVNRFLAFRIGGGYQIAMGGKWKVDNGQTINNVPDINRNSVFIQTGIFVGYFNY